MSFMSGIIAKYKVELDSKDVNVATSSLKDFSSSLPGVSSALAAVTNAVKAFETAIALLSAPIAAVAAVLAVLAVAAVGVAAALVSAGVAAAESADKYAKMARGTGESIDYFQKLQLAADLSGSSIEELNKAATQLAVKGLSETQKGTDNYSKALATLGVSTKDAEGNTKSHYQLMQDIGVAYQESSKNADQQSAAVYLLGKNYRNVSQAAAEFAKNQEELDKLTRLFGADLEAIAPIAERYNDTNTKISAAFSSFGNALGQQVLPMMLQWKESILDSITNGGILGKTLQHIIDYTKHLVDGFKNVVIGIYSVITTVEKGYATVMAYSRAAWAMLTDSKNGPETARNEMAKLREEIKKLDKDYEDFVEKIKNGPVVEKKDNTTVDKPTIDRTGATDGYQKELTEVKKLKDQYRDMVAQLGMNEEAQARYNLGLQASAISNANLRAEVLKVGTAAIDQVTAFKKATAAAQTLADEEKELADYVEKTRAAELSRIKTLEEASDPHMKFRDQMAEISRLMENYPEHAEALAKTQEKLAKDYNDSLKKVNPENTLTKEFDKAFIKLEDGFAKLVVTGKGSIKDLISSMLTEIANFLANAALKQFMEAMGATKNGSASGGWVSAVASFFGTVAASANGNVVDMFAAGGVTDTLTRFRTTQGLGIAGEAGKEAIMPVARMANGRLGVEMSGGGQTINSSSVSFGDVNINVKGDVNQENAKTLAVEVRKQMRSMVIEELANQRRPGNSLNPVTSGVSM